MNKDSLEHISSLMDGEIRRETSQFLIRRLGTDESLRNTWNRYHLIRDCLRHQEGGIAHSVLTTRVTAALAAETVGTEAAPVDVGSRGRGTSATAWGKPFAGAAIAATVALMAVFAVSPMKQDSSGTAVMTAGATAAQPFSSPNIPVGSPVTQQVNLSGGTPDRAVNSKMNSYLLRHYQVAGASPGKGFVSFVPIVVATVSSPGDQFATQAEMEARSELNDSATKNNSPKVVSKQQ